jgi:hypothetical protein
VWWATSPNANLMEFQIDLMSVDASALNPN